jgi:hypothetical protein
MLVWDWAFGLEAFRMRGAIRSANLAPKAQPISAWVARPRCGISSDPKGQWPELWDSVTVHAGGPCSDKQA